MARARDEAKRDFLNALRALVLEGSPKEWAVTTLILAVPIAAATYGATVIISVVNSVMTIALTPVVYIVGTRNIDHWAFTLIYNSLSFLLVMIALFAMSRLLRRII